MEATEPKGEARKNWLHLRLTKHEAAALRKRAERDGRQVSDLARAALAPLMAGDDRPPETHRAEAA